jgi:hypothetical protein
VCDPELILLDSVCKEVGLGGAKEQYNQILDAAAPAIQILRNARDRSTHRNKSSIKNAPSWTADIRIQHKKTTGS